ncbi:MAG: UDPGP type 1 family protein [Clostridia bacterium]|nr:UDPGP type 1 family protein [Clostridia bacterium]
MEKERLFSLLSERRQEHLLQYFDGLTVEEKADFARQIRLIDWKMLDFHSECPNGEIAPILPPPKGDFRALGVEQIKNGKVAAVLLAGGQGTRLGSDAPKGTYDIGVTKPLYIFECLFKNLISVNEECRAQVPLLIMTSEKTDEATRAFLKEHAYFGYPADMIRFFVQDTAPCVDEDGKIMLESKGKIATAPNGNGGWFSSLLRTEIPAWLNSLGVEWLNVFAVDNVLQKIADPAFVGATVASGKNCGAKVVKKANPFEKVGVLCLRGGKPDVVEYYEMDENVAQSTDGKGELLYPYGVILNYLFRVEKLQEVAQEKIPVHVVKKKIPYLSQDGTTVCPQTENGYKFETLIVDMVRLMDDCLPFVVEREKEFAPIKNAEGVDSVQSARLLLQKNGVKL